MTSLRNCDDLPIAAPTEFYGNTNVLSGSDPNIYGYGDLYVNNNLYVNNDAMFCQNVEVDGDIGISGKIKIEEGLTLKQDLGVSAYTYLNDLEVQGSTNIQDLTVDLGTTFNKTITINGDLNITGEITQTSSDRMITQIDQVAKIYDEKPLGTDGGTFPGGSWQTRDLTSVNQDGSFVNLSNNEFTLSVGHYILSFESPAYNVNSHQIRLYNVSDGSVETNGSTSYAPSTCTHSRLNHYLELTSSKTFRIEHRCSISQADNGYGIASNWGPEIYTNGIITKYT